MNDQSKPQTAQEWANSAPSTAGDADDLRNDPEYQESLHDTQVTQRLADWAMDHLGKDDWKIFTRLLSYAYEGIRPEGPHANVWDLDIS